MLMERTRQSHACHVDLKPTNSCLSCLSGPLSVISPQMFISASRRLNFGLDRIRLQGLECLDFTVLHINPPAFVAICHSKRNRQTSIRIEEHRVPESTHTHHFYQVSLEHLRQYPMPGRCATLSPTNQTSRHACGVAKFPAPVAQRDGPH